MSNVDLKTRAESAEKTVAILKAKVIELYNGGAQSVIHKQLEKARQRDEENRRKRELMEVRNQELKKYSETLESEVARRTEEIKTILNNVTFGFLTVDRALTVGEEFTRSCTTLFGTKAIGGKELTRLLGLNERDATHFRLSVDQVFEDIMPPEVTLAQMPQRFVVDGRVLKVEGSVVRSPKQQVSAILFTVSDNTALETAQREAATNRALIDILRQKDAFQFFLADVREQLRLSRAALRQKDMQTVRRYVHTIKGNSASYGLIDIAHLIHQLEEAEAIDEKALTAIETAFRGFLDQHQSIIGIRYEQDGRDAVEVSGAHIETLRSLVADVKGPRGDDLRNLAAEITQRPAGPLLGPIGEFVGRLAERLDKSVAFELVGGDLLVDLDTTRGVLQSLVHLVRNAVDHGIEPASQRGKKGERAKLQIKMTRDQGSYCFVVADDGRGIDPERIARRAVEKGFIAKDAERRLSPKARMELIFIDGLSSAEQTTDISGRGVGMSAVLQEVRRVGGTLDIDSKVGVGTTITIRLPLPEALRMQATKRKAS